MKVEKEKKSYQKPKVVYEKKIETLAVVCDSNYVGPRATCCMKASCIKRSS